MHRRLEVFTGLKMYSQDKKSIMLRIYYNHKGGYSKMPRRTSGDKRREHDELVNMLRSQLWMIGYIAILSTLAQGRNEGKTIILQYANERQEFDSRASTICRYSEWWIR